MSRPSFADMLKILNLIKIDFYQIQMNYILKEILTEMLDLQQIGNYNLSIFLVSRLSRMQILCIFQLMQRVSYPTHRRHALSKKDQLGIKFAREASL